MKPRLNPVHAASADPDRRSRPGAQFSFRRRKPGIPPPVDQLWNDVRQSRSFSTGGPAPVTLVSSFSSPRRATGLIPLIKAAFSGGNAASRQRHHDRHGPISTAQTQCLSRGADHGPSTGSTIQGRQILATCSPQCARAK